MNVTPNALWLIAAILAQGALALGLLWYLGTIRIPKIGLEATMREGVWLTVIDEGPAHWPGTAMPGGWGNVVVAGHRVTHSHPFRDLDLLAPGDEISFTLPDGSNHTYRMTAQLIVDPSEVWIVDQAPGRTLTLFACHPKGSARQRIVVRGEWVSSTSTPPPRFAATFMRRLARLANSSWVYWFGPSL